MAKPEVKAEPPKKKEDDGLIEMFKADSPLLVLRVHPNAVKSHITAGWKVANGDA